MNLFIASYRFNKPITELYYATIPFMLILFVAVLSYGVWMGLDVDCGCFDPENFQVAGALHGLRSSLYRDSVMLAGTVFMYTWRRYRSIQPVRITQLMKRRR